MERVNFYYTTGRADGARIAAADGMISTLNGDSLLVRCLILA
jgi:hypothetical protein